MGAALSQSKLCGEYYGLTQPNDRSASADTDRYFQSRF